MDRTNRFDESHLGYTGVSDRSRTDHNRRRPTFAQVSRPFDGAAKKPAGACCGEPNHDQFVSWRTFRGHHTPWYATETARENRNRQHETAIRSHTWRQPGSPKQAATAQRGRNPKESVWVSLSCRDAQGFSGTGGVGSGSEFEPTSAENPPSSSHLTPGAGPGSTRAGSESGGALGTGPPERQFAADRATCRIDLSLCRLGKFACVKSNGNAVSSQRYCCAT